MDTENVQERRRLPRCGVCRLPADVLAEVQRERLAWNTTYEQLAERLRASGHATSTSAIRRHFKAHVQNSQLAGSPFDTEALEDVATPLDPIVGSPVDDRAVADAMVNLLVEQLQHGERVRRASRDSTQADRLTARTLKQVAALDRAIRRRQEIKRPYEELRVNLIEAFDRLPTAAGEASRTAMNEHLTLIDQAVDEFLRDYQYPDRLLRRLNDAKANFPRVFASRVVAAVQGVTQGLRDNLR